MKKVFKEFLDLTDGYFFAQKAQESFLVEHGTLPNKVTYGEITAKSCEEIIKFLKNLGYCNGDKKILDLGSGIGKFMIAMHYKSCFKEVYGAELLDNLAKKSNDLINEYSKKFNKAIDNIKVINKSVLAINFEEYDIIFSNTSVDKDLREDIAKKISRECKKNTVIITTLSEFNSFNLEKIYRKSSLFSWGKSTLYFYKKI